MTKRYLEKISCLGIDLILISDKAYDPDCLPRVESMDLLSFLVLETNYYSKELFGNQLVSGFMSSVNKHKMGINYIVLEKVTENERSVCYTVDYNQGKWYCTLRSMYGWTTAGQQEC